jgi:hypothetical protein
MSEAVPEPGTASLFTERALIEAGIETSPGAPGSTGPRHRVIPRGCSEPQLDPEVLDRGSPPVP